MKHAARLFLLHLQQYARFEWEGWSVYRARNLAVLCETIFEDELRPVRLIQSGISGAIALAILWPNELFPNAAGYHYIREWIREPVLGALFLLHSIGKTWRLTAFTRNYGWTLVFGFLGILTYFGVPIAVYMDLGRLTPAGICMLGVGSVEWWLIARRNGGKNASGH